MTTTTGCLKPATLTHREIRAFQTMGAVHFIGRNGDRCRVLYSDGWKGFRLQGDAWVAIQPKIKAGGFLA